MPPLPKARCLPSLTFAAVSLLASASLSATDVPQAIAVPGETPAMDLHAEGAQINQCEAGSQNTLVWRLREPIATLIRDGNSVGRHYAALHWEYVDATAPLWVHNDGSSVKAKIVARAAGATARDIPLLKLRRQPDSGNGAFYAMAPSRSHRRGRMAEGVRHGGSYLQFFSADCSGAPTED